MTDSLWKILKHTPNTPAKPSSLPVSFPAPMSKHWFRNACAAQDTIVAANNRIVYSQTLSGAQSLLVNNDTPDTGMQNFPEVEDERMLGIFQSQLTPGTRHFARVMYVPSGAGQWDDGGGVWGWGISGTIKFTVKVDNGTNTNTETYTYDLEGSNDDEGEYKEDAGGMISQMRQLRTDWLTLEDTGTKIEKNYWSEDTTVQITVEVTGGARVISICIWEQSWEYVQKHDQTDVTLHCYPNTIVEHPTLYPVEEDVDGATYDENRFGVHRVMQAANKSLTRLGPMICTYSTWNDADAGDTDTGPDGIDITSTTWYNLHSGIAATTAWDEDYPGFDVPGHFAQRWDQAAFNLILEGAASVIPVRVFIVCSHSAGSVDCDFLFQSTERSAFVRTLQPTASDEFYTFTGHLESSRDSSDIYPNLQIFCKVGSGTLTVKFLSVEFGDWAVNKIDY